MKNPLERYFRNFEQKEKTLEWSNLRLLSQACRLQSNWLNNELKYSPFNFGEPGLETLRLRPYLTELNNRELLTVNWQEGELSKGFAYRAWVAGYCSFHTASLLVGRLAKNQLFVNFVYPPYASEYPEKIKEQQRRYKVVKLRTEPDSDSHAQRKGYPDHADDWRPVAEVHQGLSEEFKKTLDSQTVYFNIADTEWGRAGYLWQTLLHYTQDFKLS